MENAKQSGRLHSTAQADLPAGDLPPVPKWAVALGFGVWAAWLLFLAGAAISVHR